MVYLEHNSCRVKVLAMPLIWLSPHSIIVIFWYMELPDFGNANKTGHIGV